ncbi:MAG TPA: DUF6265 family protein, partial [Gemmatimonadales bacterium]|nr:DUF6265 family protein [Gemmatimonadales bacterium]
MRLTPVVQHRRRHLPSWAVALAIMSIAGWPAAHGQGAGAGPATVAQLGWMAGCWERVAGSRRIEEQWMAPRGGLMLGMSRTMAGDTLREYEQVALFERDGRLVYAATPARQAPAEFSSIAVSDSAVIFENPGHDFPQRVIYRRRGADSLIARVEGMRDGRLRGS